MFESFLESTAGVRELVHRSTYFKTGAWRKLQDWWPR